MTEWWDQKGLDDLSRDEWEALCDGCARCCLHKLEDEDTSEVLYTRIRCRYLDEQACQCSDYTNRTVLVPECIELDRDNARSLDWLPSTCAYRLRANGEKLREWHPLVSGSRESVHEAGISIRGRCVSEDYVHPDGYDEHIVHWAE